MNMEWIQIFCSGALMGLVLGLILDLETDSQSVLDSMGLGFLGGFLGHHFLWKVGPSWGNFYLLPCLMGSAILVTLVSFLSRQIEK